jgi:hypothetical protein
MAIESKTAQKLIDAARAAKEESLVYEYTREVSHKVPARRTDEPRENNGILDNGVGVLEDGE